MSRCQEEDLISHCVADMGEGAVEVHHQDGCNMVPCPITTLKNLLMLSKLVK